MNDWNMSWCATIYGHLISEYTGCTEKGLKIAEVEQNFPSHYSFFSQVTPKGGKSNEKAVSLETQK